MILTDADQLREALRVALEEREKARSEVRRAYNEMRDIMRERDDARTEADDLRSRLAALQETNAATMRVIAEGQREACAEAFKTSNEALAYYQAAEIVRATPLVTEVEP